MTATEPPLPLLTLLWRRTWGAYRPKVIRGRIRAALRVLFGRNASIPTGRYDTALGPISTWGYYGGCRLELNGGDIYWTPQGLDGWGAAPGQDLFELNRLPMSEWPRGGKK